MLNALAIAALAFDKTLAVVFVMRFNESHRLDLQNMRKRAVEARHPQYYVRVKDRLFDNALIRDRDRDF